MSVLSNVAIQWAVRRIPEYSGIIAGIVGTIALAPPDVHATIMAVLTGQGGTQTLIAYLGLASWIYAQIISFRATVKPETVTKTPDGTHVTVPNTYNVDAVQAGRSQPPRKSLADILKGN